MNIPYNMIHIWVGPLQPPLTWMNTWKQKHPNWTYRIFDEQEFRNTNFYNQHLIEEYYKRGRFNGVADLIRYELLYKEGGFLPPADAVCLHNTEELFVHNNMCYTVYENEKIKPDYVSPILASPANHPFLKFLIEDLHKLSPSDLKDKVWESTGNGYVGRMIKEHLPDVKIFPSHYFIPQHYDSTERYNGTDKVYCDQMWGTTKKIYDKGI